MHRNGRVQREGVGTGTKPTCFAFASRDRLFALVLGVASALPLAAGATEVGPPEFRLCTQNLHRLGADQRRLASQLRDLTRRIDHAQCDVVAVQEVFGRSEREAELNLGRLAASLEDESGDRFSYFVGEAERDVIRLGFLVRQGVGTVRAVERFENSTVPRLSLLGPRTGFTRPPLALIIDVPRVGGGEKRTFFIGTFHLKSQVEGWKDPSGLNFEIVRMEMAEALRTWARSTINHEYPGAVLLLLGDRNSSESSASAAILRGERELADFRGRSSCRVEQGGEARCGVLPKRPTALVDILASEAARSSSPDRYRSYRFRGRAVQLDEILIAEENQSLVRPNGNSAVAGSSAEFQQASDHRLLWVDLNW